MIEPADKRDHRRDLIAEIVADVLDHPSLRQWLREVMLLTLVEQEDIRKRGSVRVFLDGCAKLGVKLSAWENGKIGITRPDLLTPELRAVFAIQRAAIWEELVRVGQIRRSPAAKARREA